MIEDYINVYYETKVTDKGIETNKLIFNQKKGLIEGQYISQENKSKKMLIGKILDGQILELIKFDYTNPETFYGHITSENEIYGNWYDYRETDIYNLVDNDILSIPKNVLSEKLINANSKITFSENLEHKNVFNFNQDILKLNLSADENKSYEFVKKYN